MQKKNWSVELSKHAFKHLKKLENKTANRIFDTLEELERIENPLLHMFKGMLGKLNAPILFLHP